MRPTCYKSFPDDTRWSAWVKEMGEVDGFSLSHPRELELHDNGVSRLIGHMWVHKLGFEDGRVWDSQVGWIPDGKEMDPHIPGAKLDNGKPMAGLLLDFGPALLEVAKVGTFGANKYSRGGWKHVTDAYNRYTDALLRHQLAECAEELDPESGLPHLAHEAWNALARLYFYLENKSDGMTPKPVGPPNETF